MNAERWRTVRAQFEVVSSLPPHERAVFLAKACGDDIVLKREVERLLDASDTAGDFLERPAFDDFGLLNLQSKNEFPQPRMIGPYEVVRRVGIGGMGAVYLAQKHGPGDVPLVAVKVIKLGMDTEFIIARFHHEQQILAGLDHPNIARLLDGGVTDDGLPYFVMEHIEGEPIHHYCERIQLNLDQRLDLFIEVCAAVSYAHRSLVVHRDIKPGNILVTNQGVPKLLDFGLAKLLGPELPSEPVNRTATALRMLTPEYASPEQVRGGRITTATDIYSLGVLLYEILTSRKPYYIANLAPEEIARVVCEVEPERPSRTSLVPEDLVTIVMMALRKEPQRRYASVDHFADDIRRYRAGLPVFARKDTFVYRAGKFLHRHRAGVAAAVLVLAAVFTGVGATVWQARVANNERLRAERRYHDIRRLAGALLFELDDAIADLPGSTRAREILVKRSVEYLSALETESSKDLSLQRELATAYNRVGEVQARGFGLDLGEVTGALESFHRAMYIRQHLVDAYPNNLQDQDDLADSLLRIAQVMGQMGDATDYITYVRQAATIREVLVAADPARASFRSGLAAAYETLGDALMRDGDLDGMLAIFTKLQSLREDLVQANPTGQRVLGDLADAYWKVGLAKALRNQPESALETWEKAEHILERLVIESPGSERIRSSLIRTHTQIGGTLDARGDRAQALVHLRRAVAIGETLHATDPRNAEIRHNLAEAYRDLGWVLANAGAASEATEILDRSRKLLEKWWQEHPWNAQIAVTLAGVYEGLGLAHEPTGRHRATSPIDASWLQARSWYQHSLDVWHELAAHDRLARIYRVRTERVAETLVRCDAALVATR